MAVQAEGRGKGATVVDQAASPTIRHDGARRHVGAKSFQSIAAA
jgi:hypothetical protein